MSAVCELTRASEGSDMFTGVADMPMEELDVAAMRACFGMDVTDEPMTIENLAKKAAPIIPEPAWLEIGYLNSIEVVFARVQERLASDAYYDQMQMARQYLLNAWAPPRSASLPPFNEVGSGNHLCRRCGKDPRVVRDCIVDGDVYQPRVNLYRSGSVDANPCRAEIIG